MDSTTRTAISPAPPTAAWLFVSVEPSRLNFKPSGAKSKTPVEFHLHVRHASGDHRIAWRLRSNAPTRYVVKPRCGFLVQGGRTQVTITLLDPSKWNSQHSFVVQAKEAADTDTDRRRVWADDDGTSSRVQKIRLPIGPPPKTERGGPSPAVSPAVSPASSMSGESLHSPGLFFDSSPSLPSSASSTSLEESALPSPYQPPTPNTAEELKAPIEEIRQALAEKEKAIGKVIEAVNAVKKIEVELDRETQAAAQLQERLDNVRSEIQTLQLQEQQQQQAPQ